MRGTAAPPPPALLGPARLPHPCSLYLYIQAYRAGNDSRMTVQLVRGRGAPLPARYHWIPAHRTPHSVVCERGRRRTRESREIAPRDRQSPAKATHTTYTADSRTLPTARNTSSILSDCQEITSSGVYCHTHITDTQDATSDQPSSTHLLSFIRLSR